MLSSRNFRMASWLPTVSSFASLAQDYLRTSEPGEPSHQGQTSSLLPASLLHSAGFGVRADKKNDDHDEHPSGDQDDPAHSGDATVVDGQQTHRKALRNRRSASEMPSPWGSLGGGLASVYDGHDEHQAGVGKPPTRQGDDPHSRFRPQYGA
jgi:hypothetical protein